MRQPVRILLKTRCGCEKLITWHEDPPPRYLDIPLEPDTLSSFAFNPKSPEISVQDLMGVTARRTFEIETRGDIFGESVYLYKEIAR